MIESLKKALADKIRQWAKDNKMTQSEVAVFLETSQPRVSLILSGKFDTVSLEALVRYTEELGFNPNITINF